MDYKINTISYSFINPKLIDVSTIDFKRANYILDMYLNHYFNLLGSGYVKVDYNINPQGVEGIKYDMSPKITEFDDDGRWLYNILRLSHVSYSKKIWRKIDKDYIPIDWSIDFKSGFRYSQKKWCKRQPIGKFRGSDIKVPWEISRMQHLPQVSIISLILREKRDIIIKEFKNEILDFCMTNPIKMGANWACSMDVAIRASNMLVAYDILNAIDENNILDDEFKCFFANNIYKHGEYIINNLEYNGEKSNNHYISNICGLLFISSYLGKNEIIDSWLAFSVQELINCMEKQFYEDGGNFEASTSYHRLSSELMIYSTALIYGVLKTDKKKSLKTYNYKLIKRLLPLNKQKFKLEDENFFPDWYLDRLFKAGLFTMDINKDNGEIPQIGDNDNGRFFKFFPEEKTLNHSSLISAINGIFDFDEFNQFSMKSPIEKSIIETLSDKFKLKKEYIYEYCDNKYDMYDINKHLKLKYNKKTIIKFKDYLNSEINVYDLNFIFYPCFGIYIYRSYNFYLCIFAGGNGQNGLCGHSHNDKLSFELNLGEKDIFVDPGTYLYTPIPEMRNKFRSVMSHNVLIVDNKEQNKFLSLFSMKDETRCSVMYYGQNFIKFKLTYRDVIITREFKILFDKLIIDDYCNKDFKLNFNNGEIYSYEYGVRV